MIKGNVYCIFDKVAKTITGSLMCAESDAIIMRTVKTANLGEIIEKNLDDFDLYKLGEIEVRFFENEGLLE